MSATTGPEDLLAFDYLGATYSVLLSFVCHCPISLSFADLDLFSNIDFLSLAIHININIFYEDLLLSQPSTDISRLESGSFSILESSMVIYISCMLQTMRNRC